MVVIQWRNGSSFVIYTPAFIANKMIGPPQVWYKMLSTQLGENIFIPVNQTTSKLGILKTYKPWLGSVLAELDQENRYLLDALFQNGNW